MFIQYRSLLNKIIFNTTVSRKQTTPKFFRDPQFTVRGLVKSKPKSYKYDLEQPHIKNKHLYYNNTENNRKTRYEAHLRRLKRLKIRPILRNNEKLVERPLQQIIKQLKDKYVIRMSSSRTYTNLFQIFSRFPEQVKINRQLMHFVIKELEKQIYLMNFYEFSHFCMFSKKLGISPKSSWVIILYHHLVAADALKVAPKLEYFALMVNYLFSVDQSPNKQILYKSTEPFKLFEDNDPRPKTFEQLSERVFTVEFLTNYVKQNGEEKAKSIVNGLNKLPGNTVRKLESLIA